jgi:hypothetical protein
MQAWTIDELKKIEKTDELRLMSLKNDGTLRKPVTIWVVRVGDDLFIRAVNGRKGKWFQGTQERGEGHVRCGGVEKDVFFAEADNSLNDFVDAAYRSKYRRYALNIVNSVLTPQAKLSTLKLVPR